MKFKNDLGRSMMEMILYLGLIVVLSASTIKMYSDSVEKTRVIQAEDQVGDIVEIINTYYMGRQFPLTGDLTNTLKTKLGDQINLVDPWGSNLAISANKTGTTGTTLSKPYFGIKFKNLSPATCVSVANIFIKQSATAIGVNKDTGVNSVPSISEIATSCSAKDINTVQGFFLKE